MGEAAVALVKAAKRYDPSFGVPFDAFAVRAIRGALMDVVRTIARRETLGNGRFVDVSSIDTPRRHKDQYIEWEPPDPHSLEELVEALEVLRLLGGIPASERHVLIRMKVDGAEASEIAEELGVSADRVYALVHTGSLRLRIRRAKAA